MDRTNRDDRERDPEYGDRNDDRARDIGWRGTELDRGFGEDETLPTPPADPDATWPLDRSKK